MASADKLKREIDLHDLAERLGMERPEPNGNYRAQGRADKHPSVSIFVAEEAGHMMWKDHTTGEKGSCIDLVIYCGRADDASEAMRWIHKEYGITADAPEQQQQKPKLEWLAEKQLAVASDARRYLFDERKIPAPVIDLMQKRGAFGFSDWTNSKKKSGEIGYGGPAIVFPARCVLSKQVMGIDYRYFDPSLNGDLKTKAQGEKRGYPYIPDAMALRRATTVYVVESPINAISAVAAFDPEGTGKGTTTAIATRGLAVEDIDWRFLAGKKVVCCFDNDAPIKDGPRKGHRPGPEAAWVVHEACTALNIPCFLVRQDTPQWEEVNDLNDYLREHGPQETKFALLRLEQWLVYGQEGQFISGRVKRLPLPDHDQYMYGLFRTKQDFTSFLKIVQNEEEGEQQIPQDVCSFRIAGLSKVTISSANAAMTGEKDLQAHKVYSASIQTPDSPYELTRFILEREQLYNIDVWRRVGGGIFNPGKFSRMISILERATKIGARSAVNFVGLAWHEGKPIFNEGPDCYFTNPKQQCPYYNLRFISGHPSDGKSVIEAYSKTFKQSAGLIPLVWGLGCHIKTFLGFWPHFTLQADKGAGKSTLIKRIERSIGFTMLSSQSMKSEFRLVTSIGHTSHPVGWEEISAQEQKTIDRAVALLQESYQYTTSKRSSEMTEFLCVAPVLLAGEDVPVQSLQGKLIRSDLSNRKGALLPEDLPRFPVKEWIQFLTTFSRQEMRQHFHECLEYMKTKRSSVNSDSTAERMIENYSCVLLAWKLLCQFTGMPSKYGKFVSHLITEMSAHVSETNASREPWVWILHVILGEIDSGQYRYPYLFDWIDGELCLLIRTSHMMQQLSQTPALKQTFDSLPVKSDRVLKRQLKNAGVILKEPCEKTINTKRVSNLVALGVENLREFGLYPGIPEHVQEQQVNQQ
ncbi:toprim domain-containing protein [Photobacterium galatheae]|uniref:Toprim domain-containing protein n=1 Tax=Photobacterium galatheae TaxID=1654360 RepID=A0A066RUJ9_9GAMM|nr:toprim domain-containing protein [Photobacterium galatheae]KDM91377.1 hypothetical protein EA58_12520 [Photobacterium galatheae]MCM0151636.1 toprim domain-containing protein [Photobacterium galatheae]